MKKILFLIFILLSCRSHKTYVTDSDKKVVKNISIPVDCSKNTNLLIEIDKNTSIDVHPNLCTIFEEDLKNDKTIVVNIEGMLENYSFNRYAGYCAILDNSKFKSNDTIIKPDKIFTLEFGNFGYYRDTSTLKKSVQFKVYKTHFNVIRKNNMTENLQNGRYELNFILKPYLN